MLLVRTSSATITKRRVTFHFIPYNAEVSIQKATNRPADPPARLGIKARRQALSKRSYCIKYTMRFGIALAVLGT
jgi:hypothetical protein